jgi:nicotinamide riboside transporter PnuC
MSTKVNMDVIEPLNVTDQQMDYNEPKKQPLFKTLNFWIETTIFILSVVGAFCISYAISQGWLLWFVSNIICIFYFGKQKQYPLAIQQVVFLTTTIIGIVNNFKDIFGLG